MGWRRERGGLELLDLIQGRPFFKGFFFFFNVDYFKVFIEWVTILLLSLVCLALRPGGS